jgi:hypothetical protein
MIFCSGHGPIPTMWSTGTMELLYSLLYVTEQFFLFEQNRKESAFKNLFPKKNNSLNLSQITVLIIPLIKSCCYVNSVELLHAYYALHNVQHSHADITERKTESLFIFFSHIHCCRNNMTRWHYDVL